MFLSYSIVNPLTVIQIPRRLPMRGEVLVDIGDTVESPHVVAQAVEPGDFRIVNVARELNLSLKKVKSALKVKRGDAVSVGDVLAARGGWGGQVCRAPIDGTVVGSGRGKLLIESHPNMIRLGALVPGKVVEKWSEEGVLIETVGAQIQAAWGNGREAYGTLRMVVKAPKMPIRVKHIDAASQGAILVGGSRIDENALEQAIEMRVRGIIVGSVAPSLLEKFRQVDFPIIATEGIGSVPMSKAVFKLLRSLKGREAAISGLLNLRWEAARPFIIVPMPAQEAAPVDPETPLEVGSRVRALRMPYMGRSGVVAELPAAPIQLETGVRLPGAMVDFGREEIAFIPFMNLERLL